MIKERLLTFFNLLKLAFDGWSKRNAPRLAAALSYYTVFSLAPLLLIVISVTSIFWDSGNVRSSIVEQISSLIGKEGADFVSKLLEGSGTQKEGIFASAVGLVTMVLGAIGVVNELHNSLNTIWEVKERKVKGFVNSIKNLVKERLLSLSIVLAVGFLLLVSLVVSALLSVLNDYLATIIPFSVLLLQIINFAVSVAVTTILFALIFKYLPDAKVKWRDVLFGGFVTSVLFTIGKSLIGLYLGNSAVGNSFGAAGSLIVLLLWVNYSAQILLFGAEFTQVYANKIGSKVKRKS